VVYVRPRWASYCLKKVSTGPWWKQGLPARRRNRPPGKPCQGSSGSKGRQAEISAPGCMGNGNFDDRQPPTPAALGLEPGPRVPDLRSTLGNRFASGSSPSTTEPELALTAFRFAVASANQRPGVGFVGFRVGGCGAESLPFSRIHGDRALEGEQRVDAAEQEAHANEHAITRADSRTSSSGSRTPSSR